MKYTEELGDSIREFKLEDFKKFLLEHATEEQIKDGVFGHSDIWFTGVMSKLVLARTDMPVETVKKAKAYLDSIGWDYCIALKGENK